MFHEENSAQKGWEENTEYDDFCCRKCYARCFELDGGVGGKQHYGHCTKEEFNPATHSEIKWKATPLSPPAEAKLLEMQEKYDMMQVGKRKKTPKTSKPSIDPKEAAKEAERAEKAGARAEKAEARAEKADARADELMSRVGPDIEVSHCYEFSHCMTYDHSIYV